MKAFARVVPEGLRIREEYPYQIEISANSITQPAAGASPEGRVEIVVPYDGFDFFTRQAIGDLERQGERAVESIQIGHLLRHTPDIAETGEWRDGQFVDDHAIVELPVSASYKSDTEEAQVLYRYQPTQLAGEPIQLTARLLDDEIIMQPSNEKYLRNLSNKVKNTGLYLILEVRLLLPYWLHYLVKEQEQLDLQLSHFVLQWPTIPDPDQINLWLLEGTGHQVDERVSALYKQVNYWRLDGKSKQKVSEDVFERPNWLYDPASRSLVFEKIQPFWQVQELASQAAYALTTRLLLQIRYPGDLYPQHGGEDQPITLTGQMRMTWPNVLYSGSTFNYFDALGKAAPITNVSTDFSADFEIFLEDNFLQRETSTFWLMSFEGLSLTRERLLDIRHALGDLGYEIQDSGENLEARRCTLLCSRWEEKEGDSSRLWLTIKDVDSAVQWEQEVPGGAKFTAEVPVGKLTIEVRGLLAGGSTSLNHGISQLQARLKQRLYAMSTLQ